MINSNNNKNRRGLKKNKRKESKLGNSVTIVGINAAGITSKIDSFDKLLFDLQPSIFMLQETKRKPGDAKMKAKNLANYQLFELRREKTKDEGGKGLRGGGLALSALHDLKPVLVKQGDDEVECMSVEVITGLTTIRCVVGYGPQVDDSSERKEQFWNYLDTEVTIASDRNVSLVIQIDSNAWAGPNLIPGDPNQQNRNGKKLQQFLERNKNITLVNSLPICEGIITRKRVTESLNQTSVLDLFLVCERMLPFVTRMHVDIQGSHQLTNFGHKDDKQKKSKVTESDHAKVELNIDLNFPILKPVICEECNFKSTECQKYFESLTSCSNTLSRCFETDQPFLKQVKQWEMKFKSCIIQSFSKIRTRKRKFCESEIGQMLEVRKQLKMEIRTNPGVELETKLLEIDAQIAYETQHQYFQTVNNTLGNLTGDDGGINTHGLWNIKNRLIPKDKSHNVTALKDKKGNFITDPEGLKELCLSEILERLINIKINPDLVHLQTLKETLCHKILAVAARRKSTQLTIGFG